MRTTVLREILAFLFGYRYYINIVKPINVKECGASYFIFTSKEQARKHQYDLDYNKSFDYVGRMTCYSRIKLGFDGKHNFVIDK